MVKLFRVHCIKMPMAVMNLNKKEKIDELGTRNYRESFARNGERAA